MTMMTTIAIVRPESYFDDDDCLGDSDSSYDDDIDDCEDDDDFGDGNEVAEALEDIGIDLDEFESMSFKEQCEALEEAGPPTQMSIAFR